MKFNPFYLLMFVLLAFSSCSKDEDFSESDLLGTWQLTNISCNDGKIAYDLGGININGTFKVIGKDYDASITFSKTGEIRSFANEGSYNAEVSTTVSGSTTEITEIYDFENVGGWSMADNKITLTSIDQQPVVGEITKLDANNLEYTVKVDVELAPGSKSTGTYVHTFKR